MLQLRKSGYDKSAALLGGLQAWKDAGFEVEKTAKP